MVGIAAAVLAFVVLVATHSEPHPPFPKDRVQAATLKDPGVAAFLKTRHWTEMKVAPLDRTHWRVTVQDGPRSLLDASLGPHGTVEDVAPHYGGIDPPGSRQVWALPVLLMLTAIFCFVTMVLPLRSLRNLDALVFAVGLLVSLILYDQRLIRAHVFAGTAALLYIAVRCALAGLRPTITPAGQEPLWRHVSRRLGGVERRRLLGFATAALVVLGVIVTITSTGLSDVAFAGLAGATALTHGLLPYGHVTTEVVHGDTYPLLTYVLYLPFALLSPVDDSFDGMDGSLTLNTIALVLTAFLIFRTARRLASTEAGLALAIAWLAFPAVLLASSSGGNDVPATVFVAAGLVLWTRPAWATLMLSIAAWVKIVPGVLLAGRIPQLRGRPLVVSLAIFAAIGALVLGLLLAIGGSQGPSHMIDALHFQVERGSYHSLWRQLDSVFAQQVFEAATFGLFAAAIWLVAWNPELSSDLRRIAALFGSIVLLVQLGGNYWTAAYLPWAMPLILIGLFLPVTTGAAPAPPAPQRSRPIEQPVP
jgi:hypothetical protein